MQEQPVKSFKSIMNHTTQDMVELWLSDCLRQNPAMKSLPITLAVEEQNIFGRDFWFSSTLISPQRDVKFDFYFWNRNYLRISTKEHSSSELDRWQAAGRVKADL